MRPPISARLYAYVGPKTIRWGQSPAGAVIASLAQLQEWLDQHPSEDAATFVIDRAGNLLLAERRSEHVACAGGQAVLSAGEMFFARSPLGVVEVTNQSIGFCPEPESWLAVAVALDRLPVPHPGGFTRACDFRRCPSCGQINIIKDGWFGCGFCAAELPPHWNF